MTIQKIRSCLTALGLALALCSCNSAQTARDGRGPSEDVLVLQYLEIVTPDVEATCGALEKMHGVRFGAPIAALGNARTAALSGGGRIGVRAPMREDEAPVVRPYRLVEDIDAAVRAAQAAGAQVAMAPMEIPGQGTFAIYVQGGIQHGLWKL